MSVCSKCGRRFPESKHRIICLCDAEYVGEISINFPDIKPEPPNIITEEKDDLGRKAWLAIHNYVYETKEKAEEFYYTVWKNMIPGYGCPCKDNFKIIEMANPPNFNSKEEFFEWSVFVHNLVNEKLNKDIMPLDEAKKVYNIV